jgi:type III secretion protein C
MNTVRILNSIIAAALVATVTVGGAPALAASPFGAKKFVYRAEGKKLSDVLQDFAASQDVPIVVDASIDGTVNAEFNTRPEEFLNAMTRTYGVIWYHDGTTLFIYPSKAMQSKVFRMRGFDRNQVRQMLSSLGLGDARFPLRFDEVAQTLLAYGPPRHIELVSTVLEQLERDGKDRVGKSIRIFPLRFASAGDRTFGSTTVPGLATTLNNLFTDGAASGSTSAEGILAASASMVGKSNKAKAFQQNYGGKPAEGAVLSPNSPAAANYLGSNEAPDKERPYFQADESTNSLIVRGLPDRMQEYAALINQLDAPQDLVEIEASIIDISSDEFESLGMDFNFSRNGSAKISLSPGSGGSVGGGGALESLAGTNITTVIGNAGAQLLARIRALEGTGKAHILSRPKVLGAVNRMASMIDKRTASVRVAGNLDAQLFTVEAGTKLQVTPQIVNYADHRKVRMSLAIQDGNFEGTVVDQVPIVKQTEINTEATIREGESLLIGGISIESDGLSRTAVPLLGKIPFLGAAFRHTEGKKNRTERLFLITPKVISISANSLNVLPVPQSEAPGAMRPTALTYSAPPTTYGKAPVPTRQAPQRDKLPAAPVPTIAPARPLVATSTPPAAPAPTPAAPRLNDSACAALGLSTECAR